jgi:hypothetical protein
MGPIRRSINLVLALALTGSCAFWFLYIFLYLDRFYIWMPVTAGVGTFVGLYWLWADFINADPRPEK